jgi:molybdate transport system substrate-binding protein
VENQAPFDVFTAADAMHVDELDRKNLLLPGSRAVYARGVLALWIPLKSTASVSRIEDLTSPEVRVIAMAKPELAPYGQAAVESLQSMGIWEKVKSKVVFAENINMAKQYGTANNADAVFTAYALVLNEGGKVIRVDEKLHQPIDQELGILVNSEHQDAARKFTAFLLTGDGKAVLREFGYEIPSR